MKNILLTAKHLANKENSNKITIEHVKNALETLEFKNEHIKDEVWKYLNIKKVKQTQLINEEDLNEIATKPKISFGDKTKDFINFLKSKGFNTSDTFTKLYYKDKTNVFQDNAKKLIELGKIKTTLASKIFDQDIAIESVKDVISRAIFEEREDAVKAILFFVGPPATGKTFLSEETGKILKDFGFVTKVFNMTMYSEDTSNLTGLAAPMAGAGKGDLSKFIEENPKSLIVFDEIEKCHIQKQMDLFRLLDRGYIEDKFDNSIVKANNCILIFTSNLGKDIYDRNDYSKLITDQKETESLILQSIAKEKHERNSEMLAITPPLTSRLSASKIVLFNKVGLKAYFNMSKKEISRYFNVINEKFGVELDYSDESILASFLKYLPFFDPRRIKGKIGDDLFDFIRDYIQENNIDISQYSKIEIKVDNEIQKLLEQNFVESFENEQFNDTRFIELIDKKQTLFTDVEFTKTKTKIVMTLVNPRIEKIKNIQDFDGDVKIELDIPSGKIDGEPNANIFGHDDAKKMLVRISNKIKKFQELQRSNNPEAVSILKNIPKGILLYGPPGTGKTKLARAFAAQVEVPIIATSGKDMTTAVYVGTGVQKIKEIFKKAREYAPSILFIDEIDAIGTRGAQQGNNDTNINTLLEELDGFNNDKHKPVFVIAATNRKDNIDPAIIRPGRIEEHIEISALTKEARLEFLTYMFKNDDDFDDNLDAHKFLKYTVGMSGAQIEMIFKKAKYELEIKRELSDNTKLQIDLDFLINITNEVRYGKLNKSRVDAKFENMLTAYHEAGHAIVSLCLNPKIPIEQITIAPRADFGGFVSYNHEEVHRWDKQLFIGKVASAYAGRIAEEIYFEKTKQSNILGISSGASADIEQSTNLIKQAVLNLGMDKELGLINYDKLTLSENTKQKIDKIIIKWQEHLYDLSKQVLLDNWDNVELIVKELIGDEKNEGKETIDSVWLKDKISLKSIFTESINNI